MGIRPVVENIMGNDVCGVIVDIRAALPRDRPLADTTCNHPGCPGAQPDQSRSRHV